MAVHPIGALPAYADLSTKAWKMRGLFRLLTVRTTRYVLLHRFCSIAAAWSCNRVSPRRRRGSGVHRFDAKETQPLLFTPCIVTCIIIMSFSSTNHPFAQPERRRAKAWRRLAELTSDLEAPPKGTLSLRREFFKCNESKVLPKQKTLVSEHNELLEI